MNEEWNDLMHACIFVMNACKKEGTDPLKRILSLRATPEERKQVAIILAKNLHYEANDFPKDVFRIETWMKALTLPTDQLPTLIGIHKDIDRIIEKRLKA